MPGCLILSPFSIDPYLFVPLVVRIYGHDVMLHPRLDAIMQDRRIQEDIGRIIQQQALNFVDHLDPLRLIENFRLLIDQMVFGSSVVNMIPHGYLKASSPVWLGLRAPAPGGLSLHSP